MDSFVDVQQLATSNFPLAMICFLYSEFLENRPPRVIDIEVDTNDTIGILCREVYKEFKMKFERARIGPQKLSLSSGKAPKSGDT